MFVLIILSDSYQILWHSCARWTRFYWCRKRRYGRNMLVNLIRMPINNFHCFLAYNMDCWCIYQMKDQNTRCCWIQWIWVGLQLSKPIDIIIIIISPPFGADLDFRIYNWFWLIVSHCFSEEVLLITRFINAITERKLLSAFSHMWRNVEIIVFAPYSES